MLSGGEGEGSEGKNRKEGRMERGDEKGWEGKERGVESGCPLNTEHKLPLIETRHICNMMINPALKRDKFWQYEEQ
jgi:hypothetical protein